MAILLIIANVVDLIKVVGTLLALLPFCVYSVSHFMLHATLAVYSRLYTVLDSFCIVYVNWQQFHYNKTCIVLCFIDYPEPPESENYSIIMLIEPFNHYNSDAHGLFK